MTTTPTVWKSPFRVQVTGNIFDAEILGLSNGNFLVVFADDSGLIGSGAGRDLVGIIYDAEGNIVRPEFQVNTAFFDDQEGNASLAATNDGGFVMAYQDFNGSSVTLHIERYNAAGDRSDFVTAAFTSGDTEPREPSITVDLSDNSIFLSYEFSDSFKNGSIRGKAFDSGLNAAIGTPILGRIVRDDPFPDAFARVFDQHSDTLSNGDYVTVFTNAETATGGFHIEFRISDGTTGANGALANVTSGSNPTDVNADVAALKGGGFVVVWQEDEGNDDNIKFARYSNSGALQGSITTVVDSNSDYRNPSIIGLDDGGFFILAYDDTLLGMRGTRFDATGNQVGGNMVFFAVNLVNDFKPQLSLTSDGRILVEYGVAVGNYEVMILDPRDTTIFGTPGGQTTAKMGEDTTLVGLTTQDTLLGQTGNDLISGGGENDLIYGGDGNDRISDGDGDDVLYGGDGNDTISGNRGADTDVIFGGTGDDTFSAAGAQGDWDLDGTIASVGFHTYQLFGIEAFIGSNQDDTIDEGLGTIDSFSGGGGDDMVITNAFGTAFESFDGGTGSDTLDFSAMSDHITFDLVLGLFSAMGAADGFEHAIAGSGNDTVRGNTDANRLEGGIGDDRLEGFGGNDRLIGDTGNDALYGGSDQDIAEGGDGSDAVYGGSGNDTLHGGAENDTVEGGAGQDSMTGGSGTADTLAFEGSTAGVIVNLSTSSASGGHADGDSFTEFENLVGSNLADNLTGNGIANKLTANGGDDTLNAGNGEDLLIGGLGNDTLRSQGDDDEVFAGNGQDFASGGVGQDVIYGGENEDEILGQGDADNLNGDAGNDSIAGGSGSDVLYGGNDDDRLFGGGNNDVLYGDEGDDFLRGASGQDILFGGIGNDTLFGGNARDTLNGGAGNDLLNAGTAGDVFVFEAGSGNDTVTGFGDDQDTLQFASALVVGLTNVQQILDAHAVEVGTSVQFTFSTPGEYLRITNITELQLLNDIIIV